MTLEHLRLSSALSSPPLRSSRSSPTDERGAEMHDLPSSTADRYQRNAQHPARTIKRRTAPEPRCIFSRQHPCKHVCTCSVISLGVNDPVYNIFMRHHDLASDRLREFVDQYSTLSDAASELHISRQYLWRLMTQRDRLSDRILGRLGLTRTVTKQ